MALTTGYGDDTLEIWYKLRVMLILIEIFCNMYWIQSWNHGRFIKIMKESLLLDIWDWLGGIMVSTLVTHGWEVWDWDLTSSLYVVFLWKKPLSHYSLKKPLSTQDLWMGAGKLLWMPGEMLEGKVAMDKHPIKGEGGGGE